MDYARDWRTGQIVAAEDASTHGAYVCPRPGCGGHEYLPNVRIQRPHFRHYPGYGTHECELYNPGNGVVAANSGSQITEADESCELAIVLEQVALEWSLFIRLPEIPRAEFGCASLNELRTAFIELNTGAERLTLVSALELRPGVGAIRIAVPPSVFIRIDTRAGVTFCQIVQSRIT